MKTNFSLGIALLTATALSGCIEGTRPYVQGPDTVIATATDFGRDSGALAPGGGGIAYDPDGCQGWLIDDGIEGYSGRRFDPATGLPICNNHYPPGTVLRNYQTRTEGIRDWVPGKTNTTVTGVIHREYVVQNPEDVVIQEQAGRKIYVQPGNGQQVYVQPGTSQQQYVIPGN